MSVGPWDPNSGQSLTGYGLGNALSNSLSAQDYLRELARRNEEMAYKAPIEPKSKPPQRPIEDLQSEVDEWLKDNC